MIPLIKQWTWIVRGGVLVALGVFAWLSVRAAVSQEAPADAKLVEAKRRLEVGDTNGALALYQEAADTSADGQVAVRARLGVARCHRGKGNYEEALEAAQAALVSCGEERTLRGWCEYELGRIREAQEQWGPAVSHYRRAVEIPYPEGEESPLAEAKAHLEVCLKKLNEEIALYERKLPNASPEAAPLMLLELGWRYLDRGDSESALAAFQRLVWEYPEHEQAPEALMQIAWQRLKQGKRPEALATFQQVMGDYPEHDLAVEAAMQIGWQHLEAGVTAEAVTVFQRLAEDHPEHKLAPEALMQVGWIHLREPPSPAEALTAFRQVVEEYPESDTAPEAQMQVGWQHVALQEYDRAVAAFQRVREQFAGSPKVPDADFAVAWTYNKQGERKKALEAYRKVLRDHRERTDLLLRSLREMGWIYEAEKDFEGALDAYREITRIAQEREVDAENLAAAELGLATCLYKTKRFAEAEELLARLSEKYPDRTDDIGCKTAECYRAQWRQDEAIETYRRVLQEHPGSDWAGEAQYGIGACYEEKLDYATALKEHRKLLEQYPQKRELALLVVAFCTLRVKDFEGALQLYDQLLEEFPETDLKPEIDYMRARCEDGPGPDAAAGPIAG